MLALGARDLLAVWDGAAAEPAHLRLARVLAVAQPGEDLAADTLGRRNQRLMALHRSLRGEAIEAVATCPHCGTDNEFDVPAEMIAATPTAGQEANVEIEHDGRPLTVRLPRMGELADLATLSPAAAEARLVLLCTGAELAPAPALLAAIAAAFEAIDPAGVIRLPAPCAECGKPMVAEVDPAAFVAATIERDIERHLREVDVIARAYGWSEPEILALPPARRARYVAMLSGERA